MNKTISLIREEANPIIENKLMNDQFTKEAIQHPFFNSFMYVSDALRDVRHESDTILSPYYILPAAGNLLLFQDR